ncbi:MAG TPA: GPR1/FUN34/YaaH family transporter [Ktedonobacterales bacterium]
MTAPVVGPEQRVRNDGGGTLAEHWTLAGTVRGPLPRRETEALVEREQATVADPIPLGLAAFASVAFTIGTVYAGWFGLASAFVAIPLAFIYGGIGMFLAGMWAFRRGNVLAATALTTISCFFGSWAILELMILNRVVPIAIIGGAPMLGIATGPAYVAGIFVLTFWVIVGYLGIAALGENRLLAGVLLLLSFAFLCLGVGFWVGGHNWLLAIGGYALIVSALMAALMSAIIVLNSAMGREVLPAFRARQAMPTTRTATT